MKWVHCLLLVVVVSSGCPDNDKSSTPLSVMEIWPLKVGNQWVLEEQILDSGGNVLHYDTTALSIIKDTTIQAGTWYVLAENGVEDPEVPPIQSRGDGLWIWNGSAALLQFKYPAEIGDTYMCGSDTTTIESLHDSLSVPAGIFVCVNYRWGEDDGPGRIYQYHYLSPGIGVVKYEEYYRTIGGFEYVESRTVLISYTVQ